MKLMRYLPFAFFSGIHGFALFAPYAAFVLAIDLTVKKVRRNRVVPVETSMNADAEADLLDITPL